MNKRWDVEQKRDQITSWLKDDGLSRAEVCKRLGCQYGTLKRYIDLWGLSEYKNQSGKGQAKKSRMVVPLSSYLTLDGPAIQSNTLKKYLWSAGLKDKRCESCNLDLWMGKPIPLELDHLNGITNDNRIENLRILCPNCHALTPTYRGKNIPLKALARVTERQTLAV